MPRRRSAARSLAVSLLALSGCEHLSAPQDALRSGRPDDAAPVIVLSSPSADSVRVLVPSVEVRGSATDAERVVRVAYALNASGPGSERPLQVRPGKTVEFALTLDGLALGSNTVLVAAYGVGGTRASRTLRVVYRPNAPPTAADDAARAWVDSSVVVPVLANDADPDGDSLRVELVSTPASGTATVNADRTITYAPDPARSGPVTFRYRVLDELRTADTATVTVDVRPLPGPYAVTFLQLPGSAGYGVATDVDSRGRVVGTMHVPFTLIGTVPPGSTVTFVAPKPFLWENGVLRDDLQTESGSANAINEQGRIVGSCSYRFGNLRNSFGYTGCIWDAATRQRLSGFGLGAGGEIIDINERGEWVAHGAVFTGGQFSTPAPVPGGSYPSLAALNNQGAFVGSVFISGTGPVPVLWEGGAARVLDVGAGQATDVSDRGQVVGTLGTGSRPDRIFVWEAGRSTVIDPGVEVAAPRINGAGVMVYVAYGPGSFVRVDGRSFPLASRLLDPAWSVTAKNVGESGHIVGWGSNASTGQSGPVLLTPASR